MASQTKVLASEVAIADKVRALAIEGLSYAKNPYDIQRYEALLRIAAETYGQALKLDFETMMTVFKKEVGCVTPKVGADAAVISHSKILVMKRADGSGWCLPCGWVDVGETPAEAAIREVKEETNLIVSANGYIAVSKKGPTESQNMHHQINMLVAMDLVSNPNAIRLNHEHIDYKWLSEGEVMDWHAGHDHQVRRIFRYLNRGSADILPLN